MEEKLLEGYTGFNKEGSSPLLKILVSYIKPSFLFKSDVLVPIHLGRAVAKESSKDGVVSDEDLKWLYDNCIGDDDFEGNISNVNRRIGFLTGTYWAYKNYEKLGNPSYFGSFGYRKLFAPVFLNDLTEYDVILPKKFSLNNDNIKTHFINYHSKRWFDIFYETFVNFFPEDKKIFEEYLSLNSGYFHEAYVMKRDFFFDFCKWIFPILFEFLALDKEKFVHTAEEKKVLLDYYKSQYNNACCESNIDEYLKRDVAHICERLTGFYFYKLLQNPSIKYKEVPIMQTEISKVKKDYREALLEGIRNKIKQRG